MCRAEAKIISLFIYFKSHPVKASIPYVDLLNKGIDGPDQAHKKE